MGATMNPYTALFEQDGEWWIGYVEELPGANTQGATLEEASENLTEAVQMLLNVNQRLPPPRDTPFLPPNPP